MAALSDHDFESLSQLFEAWGHRRSHATKLLKAYYRQHGGVDLAALELGKALEERVRTEFLLTQAQCVRRSRSSDGTVKLLLGMQRGGNVETVLMPWIRADRAAGCVSSQIGCAMGCDFCASTRNGVERSLEAGEIIEQFLHLRREAARDRRRLSTLVFMGMGEPLLNLENVIAAVRRIISPALGAVGPRHVTVSTVGIVPGIDRLAESGLGVHLALSLHAPDDATRARLVPMNRRYGVSEIMEAARRYQAITGRITTVEYCMLGGVNDSPEQAQLLAQLMHEFHARVNLIPYNSIGAGVSGVVYQRSSPQRMEAFMGVLQKAGVVVHVRRTRGEDVEAACGQLREQHMNETPVALVMRK